jgi:hypothetical protein
VTGGAGAAYGGHHAVQAVGHARKIKSETMAPTYTKPAKAAVPAVAAVRARKASPGRPATKKTATSPAKRAIAPRAAVVGVKGKKAKPPKPARMAADAKLATKAIRTEHLSPALKHGGKAAIGAGLAGGALAVGTHLRRKKSSDWQPYSKRDGASAFGVDHDPSGQHRETEN